MGVTELDLSDAAVAKAVHDLQLAAYRVEADLIGSEQIPPLVESLDEMVDAPLAWLGIVDEGRVVAALAFDGDDERIDIDRLIVAPDRMRRGYATELIEALDDELPITVSTGTLNEPARRLYEGLGFELLRESEPVPGLSVSHYVRIADG